MVGGCRSILNGPAETVRQLPAKSHACGELVGATELKLPVATLVETLTVSVWLPWIPVVSGENPDPDTLAT